MQQSPSSSYPPSTSDSRISSHPKPFCFKRVLASFRVNSRYVGDCQLPLALRCFIEEKGRELVERGLYRNFVLHCCNLFEFGVVGPTAVFAAVTRMQQFAREAEQQKSKTAASSAPMMLREWPALRAKWIERAGRGTRKDFSGIFPKGEASTSSAQQSSDKKKKTSETASKVEK